MSATIVPFTPGLHSAVQPTSASSVPAIAELTVQIEYLHHRKPHHSDDDERRAHKQRTSEIARAHECTVEIEYPKAVERWTANDILRVIDQVRSEMPTSGPSVDDRGCGCWQDPADTFRDGRSLERVSFHRRFVKGKAQEAIWFGTAAGYAASILLDKELTATALASFATTSFLFFSLDMGLDVRALRAAARKGGA